MVDELQLVTLAHPDETEVGVRHTLDPSDVDLVVGRLSTCRIRLEHASVSRRHASFEHDGSRWTITDLGSRHGTHLDGVQIEPNVPRTLEPGSRVQFGPYLFSVPSQAEADRGMMTFDDASAGEAMISVIGRGQLRGLAQQRLNALIEAATVLSRASDVDRLAQEVVDAAGRGSGAARVFLLQPTSTANDFLVLGRYGAQADDTEAERNVSRSLVRAALEGNLVQLQSGSSMFSDAQSVLDLGIGSAICAPVRVDEAVEAALYLDARGDERSLSNDAAAFCEALAGFCGLALANLRRQEIERERAAMRRDMDAARRAQEMIMPPAVGEVGPVRYSSVSMPGRLVAGDLLDVIAIDEQRTMIMLGDVSGKGVGAAVMMATAQSYLSASSEHLQDPGELAGRLNRHVFGKSSAGTFVTMCLAIADASTGTLHITDAGHAHWCMTYPGKDPALVEVEGQLPIGIVEDAAYPVAHLPFEVGTRLVFFSDGLVEQVDATNEQFGMDRVLEVLAGSASVSEDVSRLHEALQAHAGSSSFSDDLTIASFERI